MYQYTVLYINIGVMPMNESLFFELVDLDRTYLEEAYANDADTAALVFEQYLQDLPANVRLLRESLEARDIERFRHCIHKQKPGYSYVGLTDVTRKLQELQVKCNVSQDLSNYRQDIESVLRRINSSTEIIEKALVHLRRRSRA